MNNHNQSNKVRRPEARILITFSTCRWCVRRLYQKRVTRQHPNTRACQLPEQTVIRGPMGNSWLSVIGFHWNHHLRTDSCEQFIKRKRLFTGKITISRICVPALSSRSSIISSISSMVLPLVSSISSSAPIRPLWK